MKLKPNREMSGNYLLSISTLDKRSLRLNYIRIVIYFVIQTIRIRIADIISNLSLPEIFRKLFPFKKKPKVHWIIVKKVFAHLFLSLSLAYLSLALPLLQEVFRYEVF